MRIIVGNNQDCLLCLSRWTIFNKNNVPDKKKKKSSDVQVGTSNYLFFINNIKKWKVKTTPVTLSVFDAQPPVLYSFASWQDTGRVYPTLHARLMMWGY